MARLQIKRLLAWLGLALLVALVVLQFFPAQRTNPRVQIEIDAPEQVATILQRACYDCHSNETRWPWYSYVAPASWYVVDHVRAARADLNFSEWPAFDYQLQELALDDIREQLVTGEMPLTSYTLLHPSARLTEEERRILVEWTRSGP